MYEKIIECLFRRRIRHVVSVPCQELSILLDNISQNDRISIILPQREDEALAIMLGLELSGEKCLGLFQDTLLGNSQNILGLIAEFSDVTLRIWLGARKGPRLEENPAHKYITSRIDNFVDHHSLHLNRLFRTSEELTEDDLGIVDESLTPLQGQRNLLIWMSE